MEGHNSFYAIEYSFLSRLLDSDNFDYIIEEFCSKRARDAWVEEETDEVYVREAISHNHPLVRKYLTEEQGD